MSSKDGRVGSPVLQMAGRQRLGESSSRGSLSPLSPGTRSKTNLAAAQRRASTKGASVTQFVAEEAAAVAAASTDPPPVAVVAAVPVSRESHVAAQAPNLAKKYHLELFEARNTLVEFHASRFNAFGGFDYPDFYKFCCRVFGVKSPDDEVIQKIYSEAGMAEKARVESFLEWYMLHVFCTDVQGVVQGMSHTAKGESLVYRLSKQFNVATTQIDNIKREFDKYDTNASGNIEFDEFAAMLKAMLKAKDSCDLSESRIRKFWMEIDHDGSGEVDFSEFTHWYLKYFSPESTAECGSCNLIEAFYASFNPSNQRRWQTDRMNSAPPN